jgi:hypothetical protein
MWASSTVMDPLPLENSNLLSTLVRKGRRFDGYVVLLINEDFDPCTV